MPVSWIRNMETGESSFHNKDVEYLEVTMNYFPTKLFLIFD